MFPQLFHAQRDQVAGEKLRQRRRYRLQHRALAHQVEILIYGVTRGGQDFASVLDTLLIEASGLGELQPALNAAIRGCIAIMIHNALAPSTPKLEIFTTRKNDRILDRDPALVVIPVQRPCLELPSREFALVHAQVKRMLVVVALFAYRA